MSDSEYLQSKGWTLDFVTLNPFRYRHVGKPGLWDFTSAWAIQRKWDEVKA